MKIRIEELLACGSEQIWIYKLNYYFLCFAINTANRTYTFLIDSSMRQYFIFKFLHYETISVYIFVSILSEFKLFDIRTQHQLYGKIHVSTFMLHASLTDNAHPQTIETE
ncbi:hypothetical protein ACJX0J_015655 [Zea mays]